MVLSLILSMFVGGMVFADDYDRYAPDVMDKDGVGPHGSAYGGPGYNVNIGDSLREMNQKTLAQRETYRAPAVADPCPIEVPMHVLSPRQRISYGVCTAATVAELRANHCGHVWTLRGSNGANGIQGDVVSRNGSHTCSYFPGAF